MCGGGHRWSQPSSPGSGGGGGGLESTRTRPSSTPPKKTSWVIRLFDCCFQTVPPYPPQHLPVGLYYMIFVIILLNSSTMCMLFE